MVDKDNEEVKDETKKEEVLDLTLDQVHEQTVHELENEEEAEDDSASDNKDAGADKTDSGDDDKDDGRTGDAGEGARKDEDSNTKADEAGRTADDGETLTTHKVESATELDVTKNAPGKVAVKGYDDKTYYFNDLDEVPEDFEPKSYKEFGRFVSKMTEKEASDRMAASEAEAKAIEDERTSRIQSIKDDWDRDIKSLTDNKTLPADEKERQPVIDAVFDVMNEKLARGKVIDFETGYEIYASKQGNDKKEEEINKSNEDKKKRGAMVAGAGTGASAKPRIIEGPPAGTSLDDVHEAVLNSL